MQQLQTDLQNTFQAKLYPIIQQVVAEKGIEVLFSQRDSGIVFANPALDLTADVIKRFDAAQAADRRGHTVADAAGCARRRRRPPRLDAAAATPAAQVHGFTVPASKVRSSRIHGSWSLRPEPVNRGPSEPP